MANYSTVTVRTDALLAVLTKALAKAAPSCPVVIEYDAIAGNYTVRANDAAFHNKRVKELIGNGARRRNT